MGDRENEDKSDTLSSAQPELRQKADAQDTVIRPKEAGHQGRGLGAQRDRPPLERRQLEQTGLAAFSALRTACGRVRGSVEHGGRRDRGTQNWVGR